VLGGKPTGSARRLLKDPGDEQPTARQTSVTLGWPRRSSALIDSQRADERPAGSPT